MDRLLRSASPRVAPGVLGWLLALLLLGILDVLYVHLSSGTVVAALYVPNLLNYCTTYVMEALFTDNAHNVFVRFQTLNARLQSTLLAARRFQQGTVHDALLVDALQATTDFSCTRRHTKQSITFT